MFANRITAWSLALALAFFPALASVRNASALSQQQKQIILHQIPRAAGPSGPPVATYQSAQTLYSTTGTGGNASPWTATGVPAGAAFSTRRVIVVAWGGAGNPCVASATIDGGGGPVAATTPVCGGTNSPISIYSAVVQVGATVTIIQTMVGPFFGQSNLQIYTVDDSLLSSSTPLTSFSDSSTSPVSGSLASELANGFEIVDVAYASGSFKNPSGFSVSSPSLTTDFNDDRQLNIGHVNGIPGGTGSASSTWTTTDSATMMIAAFR